MDRQVDRSRWRLGRPPKPKDPLDFSDVKVPGKIGRPPKPKDPLDFTDVAPKKLGRPRIHPEGYKTPRRAQSLTQVKEAIAAGKIMITPDEQDVQKAKRDAILPTVDPALKKFKLTEKQQAAYKLQASAATHILLDGGSRSGKTFITLRTIVVRALAAPGSRHAVLRFRFNHIVSSVIEDTFPKMMNLCFHGQPYRLDKTWWYVEFPNGSQIWFGGLDDKERTEKILGQEHVTIFFNEVSQIPYESVSLALTRLAQNVSYQVEVTDGEVSEKRTYPMRLKAFYDCNPPSQAHWVYEQFIRHRDPLTKKPLATPDDYVRMNINPIDNTENLPKAYFKMLESLSAHLRERFLYGKYRSAAENALFSSETFEKWRSVKDTLPDMQRIIIAVDPSGAGDKENAHNDAIGIAVVGLGVDGNGYLLEDLTCKAGPKVWGNIVATAFDRWQADLVVGETNYGGEMVKFTVQAAKPRVPFMKVTASRGKVVRAEPISALVEQGKIRHAGDFVELEEELCAFTTNGYVGSGSPNRGDAYVWGFAALFPGIVKEPAKKKEKGAGRANFGRNGWMAV